MEKARQDLAYTEIRAPFNTVIDSKFAEYGQYLAAGQPVARLLSSDTAEVSLQLPPSDAALLDPGADVTLAATMGTELQQWPARLLRIESRVDQQTRVMPVVVEVDSPYDASVHPDVLPWASSSAPSCTVDPSARPYACPFPPCRLTNRYS